MGFAIIGLVAVLIPVLLFQVALRLLVALVSFIFEHTKSR